MSKNTGTSELINYFDLGVNGDVGIAGSLDINTIANATTDTDTFLVSDTGIIKYRTGAQLLSDIGAQGLLTNPVTGTGTTNYLPKFTGASTIGNSNLINDASGNLGLGVTPSAWGSNSFAFQTQGGSLWSFSSIYVDIWQNSYFNGSNSIYSTNNAASFYRQTIGEHQWFNAPSGTAGNAITWTQAMTLTSGGNLLVGTTTDNGARLQVSGVSASSALSLRNTSGGTLADFIITENTGLIVNSYEGASARSIDFRVANASALLIASTGAATFSSLGTGTVYSNGGTLTNTNPSDFNLKENIAPINYGLSEILQLNAVTFNWKNDTINQGKQYGFIAQEVEKIMPDLVKKGEYLGLDKEAIFTTLVKAIQELKQEIDTLKK